jgi:hypothetical protein
MCLLKITQFNKGSHDFFLNETKFHEGRKGNA